MKSKTLFSILLLSLLPLVCPAEILIYKGSAKTTISGPGGTSSAPTNFVQKFRSFLVCDAGTGVVTDISYQTRSGYKNYFIRDFVYDKWTLKAPHNNSYTIFTQAESGPDNNGKLASHSIWIKGKNNVLRTSENSTFTFPRTLHLEVKALQMGSVDGLDEPIMDQAIGAYTFAGDETATSKQADETRAQATTRLSAKLEALGYTFAGPPYVPVE